MTPTEYFNYLKEKKNTITEEDLTDFYQGCLHLARKYKITGQRKMIEKIRFLIDCIDKEKKVLSKGINTFIYRDDLEFYIDNVAKNVVKIIELDNYPRDIPDDIVMVINDTKDIFDKMYVVFTDYTGNIERTVEKERRDKDPILFGTFQKNTNPTNKREMIINDRFYYLGDWKDDFCDLTMDKFLKKVGKEKLHKIGLPKNEKQILKELQRLDDSFHRLNNKELKKINKKGFFKRLFR